MNVKTLSMLTLLTVMLSGCGNYTYHKTSSEEEITKPSNPMNTVITKKTEPINQTEQNTPRKIIIYRVH